jgi:pSer/pThr/pTyr-binding forkhead associated (FHA) protein
MRLVVKRNGQVVKEFQFDKGPVYIGRHPNSQVYLPDRAVSRQHAAIFATPDGKWTVQDLDSANKTFLNGKEVHKAQIKTGDHLRIVDFDIEVNLETEAEDEEPVHLEDTLVPPAHKPKPAVSEVALEIITRRTDTESAPDIKLPAKRVQDFLQATETICKTSGPDEVLKALINVTLKQFDARCSWAALRNLPEGPMTSHAGRVRDGKLIELNEIKLRKKIIHAVNEKEFLLVPNVSSVIQDDEICSAMIAPIIDPGGCFGVLYVDNAADQQSYTLSDLDYLMLLAIHTAAIVENF